MIDGTGCGWIRSAWDRRLRVAATGDTGHGNRLVTGGWNRQRVAPCAASEDLALWGSLAVTGRGSATYSPSNGWFPVTGRGRSRRREPSNVTLLTLPLLARRYRLRTVRPDPRPPCPARGESSHVHVPSRLANEVSARSVPERSEERRTDAREEQGRHVNRPETRQPAL